MTKEHTSGLPHGKQFPIGDADLWNALMNEAQTTGNHFDILQRYADIRGLTRGQAKDETFSIRYFGGTMSRRMTNTKSELQRLRPRRFSEAVAALDLNELEQRIVAYYADTKTITTRLK